MPMHHIIYIPGIGDHKPYGQPQIIKLWKIFGVRPHYHPVIWRSQDESWDKKLNKLSNLVNKLSNQGDKVSLVGISAGASAALNTYTANKDKIHRVVYICGKLRYPETIGQHYYDKNPSFKQSLDSVQVQIDKLTEVDRAKMLSLSPIYDETVPVSHTKLPGVRKWTMISAWHVPSIFIAITLYSPVICGFIKRSNKNE